MGTTNTRRALIIAAPVVLIAVLAGCKTYDYPSRIYMGSDLMALGSAAGTWCGPKVLDAAARADTPTPVTALVDTFHNEPLREFTLTAEVVTRSGRPDEWSFNGTSPGPEIRVNKGDHVRVTLINPLPDGVTLHWHGVHIPNAEDGVAGLTQDAVAPGSSFTYDFIARDAGTYWYHTHQKTSEDLPKGLFGAFVVEDPTDSVIYDHDYTVVYHNSMDLQLTTAKLIGRIIAQRFGAWKRAETQVNGEETAQLVARPGELVRLRIINALSGEMPGAPLRLAVVGSDAAVRAIDGHDLNQPDVLGRRYVTVGMGQRFDVVFRMPPRGTVTLKDLDWHETAPVGTGVSAETPRGWAPLDITNYGKPARDPLAEPGSWDATCEIALGENPGKRGGRTQLVHTMNGQAFPNIPMLMVTEGETVRLRLINTTNEWHPMHLHGHVFSVLSVNGRPVTGSPIHEDSVLVNPHETVEVAFKADNPGLWMFHCHVLIHAAFGMDMMVAYVNTSTPFAAGAETGNIPE